MSCVTGRPCQRGATLGAPGWRNWSDAPDLKSGGPGHAGSSPAPGTWEEHEQRAFGGLADHGLRPRGACVRAAARRRGARRRRAALRPDPAAVGLDEPACDCEPQARVERRVRCSAFQKPSKICSPAGRPSPVSSTAIWTLVFGRSTVTAIEPSEGVWRRAFVRRLSSTRSTLSGATVTSGRRRRSSASSRTFRAPRLRADGAEAGVDDFAEPGRLQLERRVNLRRSWRARTGRRSGVASPSICSPRMGKYSCGWASPSSSASIIAFIAATGVRRSWLAQATSWRRASKTSSTFAAISLNDAARSRARRSRRVDARALRSPPASWVEAARSCSIGITIQRATSSAPISGRECGCCRDGEDLQVVVHVEHHPAGQEHRAERKAHGKHREARRAAGGRSAAAARASAAPTPASSVATARMIAISIMSGTGSRRPRPSRDDAAAMGRPRPSRAAV